MYGEKGTLSKWETRFQILTEVKAGFCVFIVYCVTFFTDSFCMKLVIMIFDACVLGVIAHLGQVADSAA